MLKMGQEWLAASCMPEMPPRQVGTGNFPPETLRGEGRGTLLSLKSFGFRHLEKA